MGALETNTTLIYGVHVRESANDGSDFTDAAADYRILFLGEDGLLHVKDSSGTVTAPYSAGGITRTQLGTTSTGASFKTTNETIYKKITVASAGFLVSIAAAVKGNSSAGFTINAFVMSDNAGTPLNVIAVSVPSSTGAASAGTAHSHRTNAQAGVINSTTRFITIPVGAYLTAADYWIGVVWNSPAGTDCQLAYSSGTGSDRTKASTDGPYDHSVSASSTGTHDHSIYANLLS